MRLSFASCTMSWHVIHKRNQKARPRFDGHADINIINRAQSACAAKKCYENFGNKTLALKKEEMYNIVKCHI